MSMNIQGLFTVISTILMTLFSGIGKFGAKYVNLRVLRGENLLILKL